MPATIPIWPRLVEAPHIMNYARKDLGAIKQVFERRAEVFGFSLIFASPDDRSLIATNKIGLWTRKEDEERINQATPGDPASDPDVARALMSLHGGTAEVMQFAAKEGLRAAPVDKLRWICALRAREAFFLTDKGYLRAARHNAHGSVKDWITMGEDAQALDREALAERARGTDHYHLGASTLTVLIDTPPTSNHARLGWESRLMQDISGMLRYNGAIANVRMPLHPDWSVAAALEAA